MQRGLLVINHMLCIVSDEKPFKCSQCESSFRKSSGLKQHVTRQHSQHAPHKLTQAQSNQASSKRSSSVNDRPYACQVTPTSPPARKRVFSDTYSVPSPLPDWMPVYGRSPYFQAILQFSVTKSYTWAEGEMQ